MNRDKAEIKNAASALGQDVGNLIETAVINHLSNVVEESGHSIRPAKLTTAPGIPTRSTRLFSTRPTDQLSSLIPSTFDTRSTTATKGSWLCVAHYNLRKSHASIRKSIAVLAGNWSAPSRELIRSFGVEILEIPFGHISSILHEYGVDFDWPERDSKTPKEALQAFVHSPLNLTMRSLPV